MRNQFLVIVFVIGIFCCGCNYNKKNDLTSRGKYEGHTGSGHSFAILHDTIIISADTYHNIINDLKTIDHIKSLLSNWKLELYMDEGDPPYVALLYNNNDTISFFADLPFKQDSLFQLRQAIITENSIKCLTSLRIGETSIKDLKRSYGIVTDRKINYVLICSKNDFQFFSSQNKEINSNSNVIILNFCRDKLKRIEVKFIERYNKPLEPFLFI